MKKYLLVFCLTLATVAVMVIRPALATELWNPHLIGVDEGLAAGALPPPGFYFIDNSYFDPSLHTYNNNGNAISSTKLFAYVDAPVLLWATGLKFLGADYAVALAQPLNYTNLELFQGRDASGHDVYTGGHQWGTYNTVVVPFILSWTVCNDWHISFALDTQLNDAWTSPGNVDKVGGPYAPSGNGTWAFQPVLGISWLYAGWNLSAEFCYAFQTENDTTHYQSGQQFAADYTLSYTWGKWTFGVGAGQENQTTDDSQFGVTIPNAKVEQYAAGPLVGYDFGPCSIMFFYNFGIETKNQAGGDYFNFRLIVPLGNLCPLLN